MKIAQPMPIYAPVAGFCLFAISICLARFAYGPLVPSLINMYWVSKAEGVTSERLMASGSSPVA
jgi:hypothetical protein